MSSDASISSTGPQKKKEGVISRVQRETPKSIPELERQPLHLGLIALAGIIAIFLSPLSFFINLGFFTTIGIGFGGSFLISLIFVVFDFIFGFLFLYCYVVAKKYPFGACVGAFVLSIFTIMLGGFGGIMAGIMGMCGGAIGMMRKSRISRLSDALADTVEPQIVDEVFLIYKDGRLIRHYTRRLKPSIDHDILSSMLVAVQDFIKDSFARSTGEDSTGAMDEMKFGDFNIVIGRGKYIIIAALVMGDGIARLKTQISKAVEDIERKHETLLRDWNGVLEHLRPINKEMKDLIDGEYDGNIKYPHA